MILFRADGNPWIGTGHIMRCLSLADALREQGEDIVFAIAEPCCQRLIQTRNFPCTVLGTAYNHMEDELSVLLPLLERESPDLVLLDSYFVTPQYMARLKEIVPLAYIDDLNAFDYPTDIVINYNIYGAEIPYPLNKSYILGPGYVPLRKEFQGIGHRVIKRQVEHVLITTGGTDRFHVALRCVEYLRAHPLIGEVVFHFVLGIMNQDVDEIQKISVGLPYIEVHCQVTDMRSLMLQCDVAVSAAGTTLYELCACGVPTITYILADNQILGAKAFENMGLMLCVGDARYDECFEEHLFNQLLCLMNDWQVRKTAAQQMQELVDGNGAKHLAGKILTLQQTHKFLQTF